MHPPCKHAARAAESGFGLIELVITVSIAAILLAIALPSFASVMRSNRVSTEINDLLSALALARNEAITRSRNVSVCAADIDDLYDEGTNDLNATVACGNDIDWQSGWMVFVDDGGVDSGSGIATPPASIAREQVIRTWRANEKNLLESSNETALLRFNLSGLMAAPDSEVVLTLQPRDNCSGQQKRIVAVGTSGRASMQHAPCT